MTTQETAQLITLIKRSYPNSFNNLDNQAMSETVLVWSDLFKQYPFQVVHSALKEFIMTNDSSWAPSPGQLNTIISNRLAESEEVLNKYEAWQLVTEVMQSRGISVDPKGEFEKLPDIIQKCIGSPSVLREWSITDFRDLRFIENSFYKRYEEYLEVKEQQKLIPEEIIKRLTEQKMIEG